MLRVCPEKVPVALHPLMPFAERYSVADGLESERLFAEASATDLAALEEVVGRHEPALMDWLASLDPHSDEYAAFAALWEASGTGTASLLLDLHDRTRGELTKRKLRLFAVACCRRIWHLIPDPRSKYGVETAEEFADGRESPRHLELARGCIPHSCCAPSLPLYQCARDADGAAYLTAQPDSELDCFAAINVASSAASAMGNSTLGDGSTIHQARLVEDYRQKHLVRDIFGDALEETSGGDAASGMRVSAAVRDLAQAVYEEKRFDRTSDLAGLLESAGCRSPNVMAHLRETAVHTRGCWVIDRILGRT